MNLKRPAPRAFTLVELLVVITIIGILTALVTPAFYKSRETVNTSKCASNLRQIGIAMLAFASENNGMFPISGAAISYNATDPTTGQNGWTQQLEKYIPTNGGSDTRIFQCPTTSILYPNSKTYSYFNGAHAAYVANNNSFAALRQILIQYPSKHILAGDISDNSFTQTDADKDDFTTQPPGPAFSGSMSKMHSGKSNLVFADGHVAPFPAFDSNSMTVWYDKLAGY